MSFLEEHWDKLKPRVPEGVSAGEVVAKSFLYPWNHDNADMDVIVQAFSILKPEVVIELGTFEGWGTTKMAEAVNRIKQKSTLYTFDAGTNPYNTLGETYGAPNEDELVKWDGPMDPRFESGWRSWGDVMKARDERLARKYKNVTIEYIEGITFKTLPHAMKDIGEWDFCFQDTVHHHNFIIREWEHLKPRSKVGSIIVFDDMNRPHNTAWVDIFRAKEPDWITRHSDIGHEPFWAERIK